MLQAVEDAMEKVDSAHSNEPSAPLKPSRWQYHVARISSASLIVAAPIAAEASETSKPLAALDHFKRGFDLLGVRRRVAQHDLPG